jgi:molybdopterin converting factor small subunit
MPVYIKLSVLLRRMVSDYDDEKGIVLENAEGKTVSKLMEELGIPNDKVFNVFVNQFPSKPNQVVKDGDVVMLGRVLGGG